MQATSVRRTTASDQALAVALIDVVHGSRRALNEPVDRVTITVLSDVRRLEPVRPSDLADQLHLDLSTVSRHVTALVDRGLLERAADPDDARAQLVRLTTQGQAVFEAILADRAATLGAAVRHWSAADRRTLVGLLERLAHDLADDPSPTTPKRSAARTHQELPR